MRRRRAAEIVRMEGDEIELALDEPVSAISPGQSLVLYSGERVLGGGVIEAGRAVGARECAAADLRGVIRGVKRVSSRGH